MAVQQANKPYAFKDKVEISIDQFAALENPSQSDLNYVKVIAQVEEQLDIYRKNGAKLD